MDRPSNASVIAAAPAPANSFAMKIYKSKRVRLLLVICVLVIGFFSNEKKETTSYLVVGGCIGLISSAFVMLDILFNKRDGLLLLFWRAFADLGVAVRFVATYSLNVIACGSSSCYLPTDDALSVSANCGFPSAFLEFFEIASEMWFLCIAIDLWKSLINPFSSTKSWMPTYHIVVWTVSLAFAIPTGLVPSINGYWFIANNVDNTAICWIGAHKGSLSPNVYIMFYIPLIVVYIISSISVVIAYRRLRHGISSTIIHRMKALVTNGINVIVYIVYWGLLAFVLMLAYVVYDDFGQRWLLRLLLYLISAKGVTSAVIWILTVDVHFTKPIADDSEEIAEDDDGGGVDLNGALRQELLYFATTGIRNCASKSCSLQPLHKKIALKLKRRDEKTAVKLSAWFFINLVVGREKEKTQIALMAEAARKKGKSHYSAARANTLIAAMEDGRMSQRTTLPNLFTESNRIKQTVSRSLSNISEAGGINSTFSGLSNFNFDIDNENGVAMTSPKKSQPEEANNNNNNRDSMNARKSEVMVVNAGFDEDTDSASWARWLYDMLDKTFGDGRRDVEFVEEEPYHFLRVRLSQDVLEAEYVEQFRTTIKERVTQGGASGAFFFFSKDEMFIAKSCTPEEFDVLTSNAKAYADYLESAKGKNSYISKVYGAYTMRIYGISLHFFVMNNLFHDKDALGNSLSIHEKYDIKGSTVNRSSVPPQEGQTATCTHCEQKFVYHRKKKSKKASSKSKGSGDGNATTVRNSIMLNFTSQSAQTINSDEGDFDANRCYVTVSGEHEPNVIMKDNDLKYKIRLPRYDAKDLMTQLENDAHFLYSVGVMDYSLLVGVHNTEYAVREEKDGTPRDGQNTLRSRGNRSLTTEIESKAPFAIDEGDFVGVAGEIGEKKLKKSKRLEVSRVVGPDTYIMGIIDFQQQWNLNKKMERFFKVQIKGEDSYGLSAIAPDIYRDRFITHIRDILDVDDDKPSSRNTSNNG